MSRPLRALVASYAFPPVGGAGVQRAAKLVKFLPEHGVVPTVLTVSNPSVPVMDHSFSKDLPDCAEVLRVRSAVGDSAVDDSAVDDSAVGDGAAGGG